MFPYRTGRVSIRRGALLIAASSVHVRVFGRGGLHLSLHAYDASMHAALLDRARRIVRAGCEAARCLRGPEFTMTNIFPPMVTDSMLVDALEASFGGYFGGYFGARLVDKPRRTASEDFSVLADAVGAPYAYQTFGGTVVETYDAAPAARKLSRLPGSY